MKAKTIRKVIRNKVDEWLSSIEDVDLQSLLKDKIIVTGGAIASMLLQEKVSDFDVYLRDRESCLHLAQYYVNRFKPTTTKGIPCKISIDESKPDRISVVIKSAGIANGEGTEQPYEYFETLSSQESDSAGRYVSSVMDNPGDIEDLREETEEKLERDEGPKYRPVFISSNAITLSHKIQIITRFYGSPEEVHANFDYVHCTNYWKSWGSDSESLVLKAEALEALLTKELKYVGSKYPICSLIRMRKFIQRGWTINAGQILKMVVQTNDLNLKDWQILRDQLVGVDAAYFSEVLSKLKEKDPEKISSAYLIEIIDRIF